MHSSLIRKLNPGVKQGLIKRSLWTVVILQFCWLGFKGKPIHFAPNNDYLQKLTLQQKYYASLNRHLLQSRYEVFISYDTLNQQMLRLEQLHQDLANIPNFINRSGHQELQRLLQDNQNMLVGQKDEIERFKSENALLKNSLQYLSGLMAEISDQLAQEEDFDEYDRALILAMDEMLQQVLIYNLSSDASIGPQLQRSIDHLHQLNTQLPNVSLPNTSLPNNQSPTTTALTLPATAQLSLNPTVQDLINLALRHTELVLTKKPTVDRLLRQLLERPTEQRSETMELAYNIHVQAAIVTTNQYRFFAFIWLLGIVGWITVQVIHRIQRANIRTLNILESITDAFVAIDRQCTITYANPQAAMLLHRSLASLIQQNFLEIFPAAEDLKCHLRQPLVSEAADQLSPLESFDPTSDRWFEIRTYPQPEGFSIFLQDISDRKRTEMALQAVNQQLETKVQERTAQLAESIAAADKARQRAEEANRAKSVFLSNMSHELRTPLNAILGFTQVLERSQTLQGLDREHLTIISRSGQHLLQLINDVLEVSKIEAGRATFHPKSFDLPQLLENVVSLLNLQAIQKGLDFRLEGRSTLPQYVKTDAKKLRQVLLNLLGNGIKFTEQGRVTLRVKGIEHGRSDHATQNAPWYGPQVREPKDTDKTLDGDAAGVARVYEYPILAAQSPAMVPTSYSLRFEIEDTGPGIAADELDTLFEPFVQTATGQQQGTGLGLPLSRQFVQLMGGTLQVRSQPGQGTCFCFTIPVERMSAEDVEPEVDTTKVIGLAPGQPCYRVLIVDDRRENRQVIREILKPLHVEIEEAVDGADAITLWETWQPHLIWMDIRMPKLDGYQATRMIRDREVQLNREPVKIIAVTASAFDTDHARVLGVGCDDFVRKPFRAADLFDRMTKYLGVQFQYEDDRPQSQFQNQFQSQLQMGQLDQTATFSLTPDHLAELPGNWRLQFHTALNRADDDEMLALLEQIQADYPNHAQALTQLVQSFQLDTLMELTQSLDSP